MRHDVRRMLAARGWTPDAEMFMRKNGALWTETNGHRDSGLDAEGFTLSFDSGVPARVIVAACEAAVRPATPATGGGSR
ncbi:hypothetical protein [Streptomyces sp. NBC_01794]|uniref:hypothetical protein n=1 Tax=Streptomyces sp. NBC_01794 TaxID=2975942 RepID=UPI0030918B39|nr:hypothetical protein OIE54_12175 [Streptomyces sp. NBC_01794]